MGDVGEGVRHLIVSFLVEGMDSLGNPTGSYRGWGSQQDGQVGKLCTPGVGFGESPRSCV